MAAHEPSNFIARRVVDDLIDFSGETVVSKFMKFFFVQHVADIRRFVNRMREEAQTDRNCIAQLTALVAETEAMEDQEEVFDTLMCLRDDIRDENRKLLELNDVIVEAEERIATKEAHVEIMKAGGDGVYSWVSFVPVFMVVLDSLYRAAKYMHRLRGYVELLLEMGHLGYGWQRMQCRACCVPLGSLGEEEEAELEALGQRGDALRSLDYMGEMVVRDSATLRVLEQLLASTHVGMRLKAGYVADMDEAEITLSKSRGLIAEIEALGARAYAVRALGNMREIVARDAATLGVLEQLVAGTYVTMRLKDGYITEMEEQE
uniref:Uncharacterized protein n=1 Tax=Tanacetum cinerariifolium TaxID=118510 RepID=A0A6L2LX86_TANCI|nr:hypothetical protein [Tanacetum cinerariifolium]